MENKKIGKADYLIQRAGCGMFQTLVVLLCNVPNKMITSLTMMLMAFGNYNPGWRCDDDGYSNSSTNAAIFLNKSRSANNNSNNNIIIDNSNIFGLFSVSNNNNNNISTSFPNGVRTYQNYVVDNSHNASFGNDENGYPYKWEQCLIFDACQNVRFNPQVSTIVTEWGLLCDKAWITSIIISIQMVGVLIGSFISGQLGDMFGRKITLYCALALNGVFNIASIFAPNWQVFAALKLFIGIWLGCLFNLYFLLPSEYLNTHWRSRMIILPTWHMGGILFAVSAMLCEDWRTMHVIAGVTSLMSCLTALWTPESLRWLEVKNKRQQFERVAQRMLKMNKVEMDKSSIMTLFDKTGIQSVDDEASPPQNKKVYTILDIFRKGFRMYSLIIGFIWLVPSMIYYAIGFGVKAMYGDFYINLIIVFAMDIPFSIFLFLALHHMGRRTAGVLFFSISGTCLLTATGFDLWASEEVNQTGGFILALLGKVTTNGGFAAAIALASEIYPTVVRSNGLGYANVASRIGGIAAPFLIPQNGESIYICYGIMGVMCLMCCVLIMKLPETKGKDLQEYFVEDDDDDN